MVAFKANPLRDISRALGVEDLSATYPDLPSQRENKPALHGIFREVFTRNTTDHWLAKLEEQDLLCAPVKSLAEALEYPQTEINDMLRQVDHPVLGEITLVGSPVHLSAARCDEHAQKVFLPVRALAIVALFRI